MDELEPVDPFERMIRDEQKAQEALSARYKSLQESLQRRINMPFDPTLMRVATALLSPTKSGTTGESIGAAAGALIDESEKDMQRQRETLKMQAEIEERMLEMKRQGLGLQALRGIRPGQKPGEPTKPTAPVGIPAGAIGIQIAPPDPSYMSDEQYAVMLYSAGKKSGEIVESLQKRRRDNMEVKESGVFDRSTNTFYAIPKGDAVEFPVRDPETGRFGNYKIPTSTAQKLSQLQGTDQYDDVVRREVLGQRPSAAAATAPATPEAAPQAPAEGAPTKIAGVTPKRPTVQESEATAAAQKAEATEIGTGAGKLYERSANAYQSAPTLFNTAETMNQLVYQNPEAFRTLSKPGLAQTIMRAADEGIRVGAVGGIQLPANTLSKYKLTQEQLDTLTLFANQMAIAKNANRQMTRVIGEGAMSDFETKLANQMLEVENASPEAIRLINQYTMMRANHIEQRHELLNNLRSQGMSINDAMTSQEMRDLKQGYESALRAIAQQGVGALSAPKKAMRGTIKSSEGGESDVPPGYIRDPKTKVIRRKREGE